MVIKRIGPLSLAKLSGTLYGILGLLFGGLFSLIALAGGASDMAESAGIGALIGVGAVVIFPIGYACIGFVSALIGAWLYNIIAGLVGGIELDVQ